MSSPTSSDEAVRRRLYWLLRELRHPPTEFRVVAHERLDPADSTHGTWRIALETVDPVSAGSRYLDRVRPGDIFYVLWENPEEEVDRILHHLRRSGTERIRLFTAGSSYMPPKPVETNLRDALVRYVDVATTSPEVLRLAGLHEFADHNRGEETRHREFHRRYRRYTRRLNRGGDEAEPDHPELTPFRVELHSLLDRLKTPGGAPLPARTLVSHLGRSYGRQYTMSDWRHAPDGRAHCEITVSQVDKDIHRPDGSTRTVSGRSSSYLSSLEVGATVRAWTLPEVHYFPSELNRQVPTIAVCTGSGVSGLLANLRSNSGRDAGPIWGVYGVRSWETKHLYGPELERHLESGRLARLDVATSRPTASEGPRRRVQQLLWDSRAEVADWLRGGAHVFLCGRLSMGREARGTFVRVLVDQGMAPDLSAAEWTVRHWERTLRFQASVSGV